MNNKKKILILGGEGFIGRNIAKYLPHDYSCFSLGVEKSLFNERNDVFIKGNPYLDTIPDEYDVIIHLIDNAVSQDEFKNQELKLLKNISFSKAGHCILFSSAVIYANPNSDYAKRKILLEDIYKEYCQKNNLSLTIFRLFNIYGEFQMPNKQGSLVANLLTNYIKREITEINDMKTQRDFIFAADMVKFVQFSIENKYCGLTDIATTKLITIKELIDILEKEVIMDKLLIKNNNGQENAICPIANNKLIAQVALVPMIEGLKKTFDFYKTFLSLTK